MVIPYATFQWFQYAWILIALITFFVLLRVTAPYGRHVVAGWGPMINNRMGWIIMELPVVLVFGWYVFTSSTLQTLPSWIMIGLFFLHYLNRIFIFPLRIRTKGKKMPLMITGSAVLFNVVNGFSLGHYFSHYAQYGIGWLIDPRFILGLILFLSGMIINWQADDTLIHLRKPGETHYVIPQSRLFRRISCPNLFGELIEWLGFALLCWNLPALTFFIWTAANLIPRAMAHHRWYQSHFDQYPAQRKAIIPFLI